MQNVAQAPVQGRKGYRLGLTVTEQDREYVRMLSKMGVPTRVIAEKLGEQYGLGRPLTNFCLYYHFRDEIERSAPVQRTRVAPDPSELEELRERYSPKRARPESDALGEIQSLLDGARARR